MTKEQVHVIIDVNEPGEITASVDGHEEVEDYSLDRLPAADLEIQGVGFERKTMSDYASTMMSNGRLRNQVAKLNERYDHAYILVEDDLSQTVNPWKATNSNVKGESLRGSMASITAREGIPVIPCSDTALLVDMAVRLARKHVEENDGKKFIPKGAVGAKEPAAKKFYGILPGIGVETAEILYEEYDSITQFVTNATEEDLRQIEGIGPARAKDIMEAIK